MKQVVFWWLGIKHAQVCFQEFLTLFLSFKLIKHGLSTEAYTAPIQQFSWIVFTAIHCYCLFFQLKVTLVIFLWPPSAHHVGTTLLNTYQWDSVTFQFLEKQKNTVATTINSSFESKLHRYFIKNKYSIALTASSAAGLLCRAGPPHAPGRPEAVSIYCSFQEGRRTPHNPQNSTSFTKSTSFV